jgi:hypothetical protein
MQVLINSVWQHLVILQDLVALDDCSKGFSPCLLTKLSTNNKRNPVVFFYLSTFQQLILGQLDVLRFALPCSKHRCLQGSTVAKRQRPRLQQRNFVDGIQMNGCVFLGLSTRQERDSCDKDRRIRLLIEHSSARHRWLIISSNQLQRKYDFKHYMHRTTERYHVQPSHDPSSPISGNALSRI